jgi:hypothetical protein
MIPRSQSNGTNIAVNPLNPRIIGATAFTASPTAIIFLSSGDEAWSRDLIAKSS